MEEKIKSLKVGQEFKSFKELVEYVGLTYREGGYPCQLLANKLHKYIDWEHKIVDGKTKRAIIITKICN